MNDQCKRISLLCATGCVMLCGWRLMPALESVRIGAGSCPASAAVISLPEPQPETTAPLPETTAAVETGTVTQPVVLAPAEPPAENPLIINRESEGSRAMWHSRLYQPTQSGNGGGLFCHAGRG